MCEYCSNVDVRSVRNGNVNKNNMIMKKNVRDGERGWRGLVVVGKVGGRLGVGLVGTMEDSLSRPI